MKRTTLRTYRRTIQISVAVTFIIIPWLNHMRISFVYGNFLSFHLFAIPLADPLAVLQITLKNGYLSAGLLIGAGIAIVLAAVLGTVFCSWICPFGLLSEWGNGIVRCLRKRKKSKGHKPHLLGFRIKLVLFAMGLIGFLIFSTTPILNQLSLPAWYSRIFQFWFEQRHISLGILALLAVVAFEIAAGQRLWCRYVCPQSVMIALAKQINPRRLNVVFDAEACICKRRHNDPCTRACSLDLDPKGLKIMPETDCTNCGDCVVACKKRGGALTFRFGRVHKP